MSDRGERKRKAEEPLSVIGKVARLEHTCRLCWKVLGVPVHPLRFCEHDVSVCKQCWHAYTQDHPRWGCLEYGAKPPIYQPDFSCQPATSAEISTLDKCYGPIACPYGRADRSCGWSGLRRVLLDSHADRCWVKMRTCPKCKGVFMRKDHFYKCATRGERNVPVCESHYRTCACIHESRRAAKCVVQINCALCDKDLMVSSEEADYATAWQAAMVEHTRRLHSDH